MHVDKCNTYLSKKTAYLNNHKKFYTHGNFVAHFPILEGYEWSDYTCINFLPTGNTFHVLHFIHVHVHVRNSVCTFHLTVSYKNVEMVSRVLNTIYVPHLNIYINQCQQHQQVQCGLWH